MNWDTKDLHLLRGLNLPEARHDEPSKRHSLLNQEKQNVVWRNPKFATGQEFCI
jgi:hypothetical protein